MAIPLLNDDVFDHLCTYLTDEESWRLAFSEDWEDFSRYYGRKRNLSISKYYSLTPTLWTSFQQHHFIGHHDQVIVSNIMCFDASHCYWLSANLLLDSIVKMPNLEKLFVNDTQITLTHLPRVFENCKNIKQLAVTLVRDDERDFDVLQRSENENPIAIAGADAKTVKNSEHLVGGFKRLTHLKIFALTSLRNFSYMETWRVVLRILGWCSHDCIDLYIHFSYSRFERSPASLHTDLELIEEAKRNYFMGLGWFRSLKSFVLVHGAHRNTNDRFVRELLKYILVNIEPPSLQHLWVDVNDCVEPEVFPSYLDRRSGNGKKKPVMLSLQLGDGFIASQPMDVERQELHHLHHLGGYHFRFPGSNSLKKLRYARCWSRNLEGFYQFCHAHPKLEHLCVSNHTSDDLFLNGDWNLVGLKTLSYLRVEEEQDVISRLSAACPNIEVLEIEFLGNYPSYALGFWERISFPKLKHLGVKGDFISPNSQLTAITGYSAIFQKIFMGCPQLKSLHLKGQWEPTRFIDDLKHALPLVRNLRDIRLEWLHQEDYIAVMSLLQELSISNKYLQRVVLIEDKLEEFLRIFDPPDLADSRSIANFFTQVVGRMEHLVALYITAIPFRSGVFEEINGSLNLQIRPTRPSFWSHFGLGIPRENDPTIPHILYEEIVNPKRHFDAPPHFPHWTIKN